MVVVVVVCQKETSFCRNVDLGLCRLSIMPSLTPPRKLESAIACFRVSNKLFIYNWHKKLKHCDSYTLNRMINKLFLFLPFL